MTYPKYFTAEDGDGNNLPFTVTFDFYDKVGTSWVKEGTYTIPSGAITQMTLPEGQTFKAVARYQSGWVTPDDDIFSSQTPDVTFVYRKIICTSGAKKCVGDNVYVCDSTGTKWVYSKNCPGGCKDGACLEIPVLDPVINSIDWSPKGSVTPVSTGAVFTGQHGSTFRVTAVGPNSYVLPPLAAEEILAELASGVAQVYKRGDTFVLDGEGYTILHTIADWECDQVVIAKNDSPNQHPAVGEEIQFSASIAWNDDGATVTTRRMEWFYLKPPSENYTQAYASDLNNWTHFATDLLPVHTFSSIDDADIIYLKVIARNKSGKTTEFGFGNCSAGLFNLWGGADGFEITVVDAVGTDDLSIGYANLVPGTNAWLVDPNILRWEDVVNGVYFGVRDSLGCAYSVPAPNMCGSYEMAVGQKYAIYRSTSFITVVPGESVFELKSGRTSVTADRTYQNFLETTICGLFGLSGSECDAFVAELYDPVFVANYISIAQTGKDTFGNERELTGFDHIALPFATLGSLPVLNLLPFGALITRGLGALSKTGVKFGDEATQFMLNFSMDASNFVSTKDTWRFLDAMGQVTEAHANEIVNALTAGDTNLANTLLRQYAGESKGWWDYHTLNDLLKEALPADVYNWLRTQIGLTEIGAGTVTNTAKQATLSPDCVLKLADAVKDTGVMDQATLAVYRSLSILDTATPQYIDEVRNILKNSPEISAKLVTRHKSILDAVAAGQLLLDSDASKAILNHADLAPDDIVGMIKSSDNLALVVNKLSDGTHRQAFGNFLDSTKKYWDTVNTQIGKTEADTWVRNNVKIARKAIATDQPAKMADISHAVQEMAAEEGKLIDDYCGGPIEPCYGTISGELFGAGKTAADDIVDLADEFAITEANGWVEAGKAYAKNVDDTRWGWFSRLSDANKEKAIHGMMAAAMLFALVGLVKIYTDAGPQSLNHNLFTSKMETAYWPCFHACRDGRGDDLADAIAIYESVITECGVSLDKYKTVLESDGTYDQFSRTLKLNQFNLGHFKSCLAGLVPTGSIRCTSNTTFFYVDLDGQPSGFSFANHEVLLTDIKTGSHTIKIHKHMFTPDCTEGVTVIDGGIKTVDCQMTEIGVCGPVSDVRIYIDPLSPLEGETIAFNGSAKSDDPIPSDGWEWDFGDGSLNQIGQAVTHTYDSDGIYTAKLTVINECEESAFATRAITVSEEVPEEEAGTLLVQEPINAVTKVKCKGSWTAEIYVGKTLETAQAIGKTTQFSIPFGTNEYIGGYGGPCGDYIIKVVLSGYDDTWKAVTINDGDAKSWLPEMYIAGTTPKVHVVSFVVPVASIAYVDGKLLK